MTANPRYKALIEFAESQAYCPCCEGVYKCEDGCTMEEDSQHGGGDSIRRYNTMLYARECLNTKE
jgi:hypothetical protein